jgi:hypothetical protein
MHRAVMSVPSSRYGPKKSDIIAAYRRVVERSEKLGKACAAVALELLPPGAQSVQIADEFATAISEYLGGDIPREIEDLEKQPEAPDYKYATPERLISLCQSRDRMQETFRLVQNQLDSMPEDFPGGDAVRALVEAQAFPLRTQLEDLEAEISRVQAEMEADSTSAADSPCGSIGETP